MAAPISESLTISVAEAARILGISRGGAYELARRGELPGALRLGGRIVVSRSALLHALEGRPAGHIPAPARP